MLRECGFAVLATGRSITRLVFSRKSGEEIVVAGLASPLTFTSPSQAGCRRAAARATF
jgi:hypothetical protein